MKRFLPFFLTFSLLLTLVACHLPEETEPHPEAGTAPSQPIQADTPPVLSAQPVQPYPPCIYLFVRGFFLGGYADRWISAAEESVTLGQLVNRPYYNWEGEPVSTIRFYAGDGPGQFDDPARAAELLENCGILEGSDFIMKLPGQLTGEAAALTVPGYGFSARFDGQLHLLVSTSGLMQLEYGFVEHGLSDKLAESVLSSIGINCDLSRTDRTGRTYDMDGDGHRETTLELIQTPTDDNGYSILRKGDPLFYALLLHNGSDCTVVSARHAEYTTDVTAQFSARLSLLCDIDGDGSPEIVLEESGWEWGSLTAFTLEDGRWTECLRADFGS